MKKLKLTMAVLATATSCLAQLKVSTNNFDLVSQNKHKNWKIIEAGYDAATSKTFVKFASPSCDVNNSNDLMGTVTTTFYGMKWNVDKLYFDQNFNYLTTESKSYNTTKEALRNNENVFGQKYKAVSGDKLTTLMSGVAAPTGNIDNSYMFKNIVVGMASVGGFKVGISRISTKFGGTANKFGPDNCSEDPAYYKINNLDVKEAKGQLWIPMFNHPVPDGGNVLFNTGNVNPDATKTHNVFRKFDGNGAILKEKAFTFDYQCILFGKEIETSSGNFDYVFVTTPINYKKSSGKLAPANQYEYIRIDGNTFETKEQLTINAPYSQWRITHVLEKDGAVYLLGEAGKTNTIYTDFSIPKPSDYPNSQIAKIENGKLSYVKGISPENFLSAVKNLNGEKIKPESTFNLIDVQLDAINGKFILSGQTSEKGARGATLINAIFSNSGELEAVITKETDFSKGYFTFTKDKSKMYWLIQDVLEYNKWDEKTGIITPKDAKIVLTAPAIATYDFNNKTVKYESLKNENWGVKYSNMLLLDDDNKLILLGGNITKKAKESDAVFITIDK